MNLRLIAARVEAGLSQVALAEKAEVAEMTIWSMENETHGHRMMTKMLVCKALGKDYDELFGGKENEPDTHQTGSQDPEEADGED